MPTNLQDSTFQRIESNKGSWIEKEFQEILNP